MRPHLKVVTRSKSLRGTTRQQSESKPCRSAATPPRHWHVVPPGRLGRNTASGPHRPPPQISESNVARGRWRASEKHSCFETVPGFPLIICTVHSDNIKGHPSPYREQPNATEILSASSSMKERGTLRPMKPT